MYSENNKKVRPKITRGAIASAPLRRALKNEGITSPRSSNVKPGRRLVILQEQLGYFFKDERLLRRALTHRSFAQNHNERLEFLGDAVLELCVSDLLYQRFAEVQEGDLSRTRAHLVRQETLHGIAVDLQLPDLLSLGLGERKAGGAQRASILADALEALLGAVYLEAGYQASQSVVERLYAAFSFDSTMLEMGKDSKTILQELLQAQREALPVYRIVEIRGHAHEQTFEVECTLEHANISVRGIGASKRAAEQSAAQLALNRLRESQS